MSSPFNTPLRFAIAAPARAISLSAAIAIAATLVVAVHRHDHSPEATASGARPPVAANAPVRRELAVSRSWDRLDNQERVRHAAPARTHAAGPPARSRPPLRKAPHPRLPVAPSDAAQTVAAAMSSTVNVPGQCLAWSREQAGIPSKYADATSAWDHATGRHPDSADPPRGAAVYWTGGSSGHGHIAISLGDGQVRSSDAGGTGQVATVSIRHLSLEWNLQYAGWANSINGYTIPGVAAA
ncbi:hypothetical protein AB3X52_08625 [Nocardioides sp. DS6]|uniref:CHAP domain-containing protein n=1 Tax=Nocardioides eburneus TaxID=3231482 RepID=A0ABV3SXM5_9ACTN